MRRPPPGTVENQVRCPSPRRGRRGDILALRNATVLAIAPHIDDVELGAGATMHRLAPDNRIHYLALSSAPLVDPNVVREELSVSTRVLGIPSENVTIHSFDPRNLAADRGQILDMFYELHHTLCPDIAFVPCTFDIHQSHQVVCAEAQRAFKHTTILGYELPWNTFSFDGQVYLSVSPENVRAKQDAVAAFRSQAARPFMKEGVLRDLASVRGLQAGVPFAECFEAIRIIL